MPGPELVCLKITAAKGNNISSLKVDTSLLPLDVARMNIFSAKAIAYGPLG